GQSSQVAHGVAVHIVAFDLSRTHVFVSPQGGNPARLPASAAEHPRAVAAGMVGILSGRFRTGTIGDEYSSLAISASSQDDDVIVVNARPCQPSVAHRGQRGILATQPEQDAL